MTAARALRNVAFVLAAAVAFLLKPSYRGPLAEIVHSHGGNFAVSFAVYFLAVIAASRRGLLIVPFFSRTFQVRGVSVQELRFWHEGSG